MDMFDYIKTLWDYNYWARDRIWPCIETISEEDFVRPFEYSMGSLQAQVVHVMWAEATWLTRFYDQPRPTFTAKDYPTLATIYEKWQLVESDWKVYLATLTNEALNHPLHITRQNGQTYRIQVFEALMHIVNHGTNHRAQILQIIHRYGGLTVEQDISFYVRERQTNSE